MSNSQVVKREQCPKCLDRGANNLVTFDDGHSYCFSCGLVVNGIKIDRQETYGELPMSVTEAVFSKRNIDAKVLKKYEVTTEETEDGKLLVAFPLHDISGVCYGKHYRTVDTTKGELTREMFYKKGTRLKLPLFGWQLVNKHTNIVVITEGETDALQLANSVSSDNRIVAVGLVGVANVGRLSSHLIALHSGRTYVIAFDNDDAGVDAYKKLVDKVHGCNPGIKLKKLDIPKEHKDISDWIKADPSVDMLKEISEASDVGISGVLDNAGIANEFADYINNLKSSSIMSFQFSPAIASAIRVQPGKLIGIVGSSGQGKSTLAEHLCMEALHQKFNAFAVSQEMSPAEFAIKLLRMVRNEPLDDPMFLKDLTAQEIEERRKQVKTIVQRMNMSDGFGVCEIEKIDGYLHSLTATGNKPDLVIVDHLLAIAQSSAADVIVEICRGLKEMARNHKLCIVLLSHVRKAPSQSKTIYRPQLDDVYGSSGLQMFADCVLAVASDKSKRETYVETVKVDRLGGKYVDVTLSYVDYCLTETEVPATIGTYDTDEQEYDDTSSY